MIENPTQQQNSIEKAPINFAEILEIVKEKLENLEKENNHTILDQELNIDSLSYLKNTFNRLDVEDVEDRNLLLKLNDLISRYGQAVKLQNDEGRADAKSISKEIIKAVAV